jgi:Rod binding domain-containing protein
MSSGISPVAGQRVAAQGSVADAAHDPRTQKLRSAATEFESMLVKQLLKAAKLGGTGDDDKSGGYGDMAVDAMATAVERGGGLGLAKRIEQAIAHGQPAAQPVSPSYIAPHDASGPHNGGGG